MVKSRKDKNWRKSSKFRGKSRKNIKVGCKSIRRKMKGGAEGSGRGFVHNLTGVSTGQFLHNIFGPRGTEYTSARLQPYIDRIDDIFENLNKSKEVINRELIKLNINTSIWNELKPYMIYKFYKRNENKKKQDKTERVVREIKERERERYSAPNEHGYYVKQNIDFAKKYIDNMFENTNKPRDYLQFEFDIFKAGIVSLVGYDTKLQLQLQLYMNTQLNNWRERSNNAAAASLEPAPSASLEPAPSA